MGKKYFLGLGNQYQCHNVIKELKSNEENVIEGTNAILGDYILPKVIYHTKYFFCKNRWILIRN